jgi:hypothetical protein
MLFDRRAVREARGIGQAGRVGDGPVVGGTGEVYHQRSRHGLRERPLGAVPQVLDDRLPAGQSRGLARGEEPGRLLHADGLHLHDCRRRQDGAFAQDRRLVLGTAAGEHKGPPAGRRQVNGIDRRRMQLGRLLVEAVEYRQDAPLGDELLGGTRAVGCRVAQPRILLRQRAREPVVQVLAARVPRRHG